MCPAPSCHSDLRLNVTFSDHHVIWNGPQVLGVHNILFKFFVWHSSLFGWSIFFFLWTLLSASFQFLPFRKLTPWVQDFFLFFFQFLAWFYFNPTYQILMFHTVILICTQAYCFLLLSSVSFCLFCLVLFSFFLMHILYFRQSFNEGLLYWMNSDFI